MLFAFPDKSGPLVHPDYNWQFHMKVNLHHSIIIYPALFVGYNGGYKYLERFTVHPFHFSFRFSRPFLPLLRDPL